MIAAINTQPNHAAVSRTTAAHGKSFAAGERGVLYSDAHTRPARNNHGVGRAAMSRAGQA